MTTRSLREALLGASRSRFLAALLLAVVVTWAATARTVPIPYPPIQVIAFWTLVGGVAAITVGYVRGGLLAGWLVAFLAGVGGGSSGLFRIVFALLGGYGFGLAGLSDLLPTIVLGTVGYAVGCGIRRWHTATPTAGDQVLLGTRRPAWLEAVSLSLALVGGVVLLWRADRLPLPGGEASSAVPFLIGCALVASAWVALRGGGFLGAWVPLEAANLVFTYLTWTQASDHFPTLVSGWLTGTGLVAVGTYAVGRASARIVDWPRPAVRGRGPLSRQGLIRTGQSVVRRVRPESRRQALIAVVLAISLFLFHVSTVTPVLEPAYPQDLDDTSVELSTGTCNGSCPIFTVEVCGDGTVHYLGYEHVNRTGYQRFSVSRETVRDLVDTAYRIDYFRLRSEYTVPAYDLPSATTRVRIGSRSHRVRNDGGGGPERLSRFQGTVYEIVEPLVRGGTRESLEEYPRKNWTC